MEFCPWPSWSQHSCSDADISQEPPLLNFQHMQVLFITNKQNLSKIETFVYTLCQKITLKVHHGTRGKILIIHPWSLWEKLWHEQIPFRSFCLNMQQSDVQLRVYYFCRMHKHSEFAVLRNRDKRFICALGFGKRHLCVSGHGPWYNADRKSARLPRQEAASNTCSKEQEMS